VAKTPEGAPVKLFRPDISIIEWRRHLEQNARPVNRSGNNKGAGA